MRAHYSLEVWLPLVAGFAIAIAYMGAATFVAADLDFARFPEVQYVCHRLAVDDQACRAGAVWAGVSSILGLSVAAIITLAGLVLTKASRPRWPASDSAVVAVCLMAALVCGAHIVRQSVFQDITSRLEALGSNASLISLENLLWPLVLQLFVAAATLRARLVAGSTLLLIAALSPFRSVLVAMALFGGVVPILGYFHRAQLRRKWAYLAVLLLLLAGAAAASFLIQTRARLGPSGPSGFAHAISQRIVMPLFQAEAAEVVARSERLPSIADNVLIKFRLREGPNLNEALYQRLYGEGTGETTALPYGESAANWSISPVAWIALAALIPALAALLIEGAGLPVATLCALAVWRGSMGGLSDVLPALVIQIAMIFGLSRLRRDAPALLCRGAIVALAVVAAGHLAESWLASRHLRAVAHFQMSPEAAASIPKCEDIVTIINREVNAVGLRDDAVATSARVFERALIVNVGVTAHRAADKDRLIARFRNDLSSVLSSCGGPSTDGVRFSDLQIETAGAVTPLVVLTVLSSFLATLFTLRRRSEAEELVVSELSQE